MSDETMTSGTRSSVTTGVHRVPTPSERPALIARVQSNTRDHKPNVFDRKSLVNATCRQLIEECELLELIERRAHQVESSIDELIAQRDTAPAFVARQYEQLHRAHTRLSFLLSAIQPRSVAAE